MHRKQAILVDDDTIVNVATGDRYRADTASVMQDASPSEPLCNALARHGFGTNESGAVIVSSGDETGGVAVTLDTPDIPRGVGRIRFYGRNGEMLDVVDIRGGFGIVADDSSLDVHRITFVTMLNDVLERVTVEGNVVSSNNFLTSMSGPDGVDYAANLVYILRRLCDALDDENDHLHATIAPFVCGIQHAGAVAPVDWLVDSDETD